MKNMTDKHKQITTPGEPLSMLDSQWGHINYQDWCEKEAERMNRNGGNAVVGFTEDGLVFVSRP